MNKKEVEFLSEFVIYTSNLYPTYAKVKKSLLENKSAGITYKENHHGCDLHEIITLLNSENVFIRSTAKLHRVTPSTQDTIQVLEWKVKLYSNSDSSDTIERTLKYLRDSIISEIRK